MATLSPIAASFLNTLEIGIVENNCAPCCIDCGEIYVLASVETYLKLWESLGGEPGCDNKCCSNTCINDLKIIVGDDAFEYLLDKGFTEYSTINGKSYLCDILEYAKNNNASAQDVFELVNVLLDVGIVIYCDGKSKITASIETFLLYAEGLGLTCSADIPPTCPLPLDKCCINVTSSIQSYLKYAEAVGCTGLPPVPPL